MSTTVLVISGLLEQVSNFMLFVYPSHHPNSVTCWRNDLAVAI